MTKKEMSKRRTLEERSYKGKQERKRKRKLIITVIFFKFKNCYSDP